MPALDGSEVRAERVSDTLARVTVTPPGGLSGENRIVGPDAAALADALAGLPLLLSRLRRYEERESARLIAPPWQQDGWLPPQVAEAFEAELGVVG